LDFAGQPARFTQKNLATLLRLTPAHHSSAHQTGSEPERARGEFLFDEAEVEKNACGAERQCCR